MKKSIPHRQVDLDLAKKLVLELRRRLVFFTPKERVLSYKLIPIGSVRRQESHADDIDLLVVVPTKYRYNLQGILQSARLRENQTSPNDRGASARVHKNILCLVNTPPQISGPRHRKLSIQVRNMSQKLNAPHIQLDLFLATEAEKAFALFHYTGSKLYNIRTRALAKRKKMLLNQYGIFDIQSGRKMPGTNRIKTEREITKFLGITYRTPTDRLK